MLLGPLGAGTRKRVFRARDTLLGRDVAVALPHGDGCAGSMPAEAQVLARLGAHPHLVTVHDAGVESGTPYVVSELMDAGDLDAALAAAPRRRLAPARAARIARDVADALAHVHAAGLVHRDVKPGNIWLTAAGHAKLGDLGLAAAPGPASAIAGTARYMAPEQALGGAVGPRSDLYALGAVLYEALCGSPPFPGEDVVAVLSAHAHDAVPPPAAHGIALATALERLLLGLLAKEPSERPDSAAAVRDALAEILARPAPAPPSTTPAPVPAAAAGPPFVGRAEELALLEELLGAAEAGSGGIAFVEGEPGIGKSRLVAELAAQARARGMRTLAGLCHEDDGAPAFWPWTQALRAHAAAADPERLAAELGDRAALVAAIVPEVGARLGLSAPAEAPDRFRQFDAVASHLAAIGSGTGLLLVLEDLHWADEGSLRLLRFVARELGDSRVLLLCTLRDAPADRTAALRDALADAERAGASRVLLRGLAQPEIARLVSATAQRPAPPALVEAVHRETDGNPFFAAEVVRLLAAEGRLDQGRRVRSWTVELPSSVREAVRARLARLEPETAELLHVASVLGREFALELLARSAGIGAPAAIAAIEPALAARLVEEAGGEQLGYRFAHALVRETLYRELSRGRRALLHLRAGEALESLAAAGTRLSELAHHFLEAAPAQGARKAVDYATRAGEQAMAMAAYEAAATDYGRALAGAAAAGEAGRERRCDLLMALGEAQWKAAQTPAAKATFLAAGEEALAIGSAARAAAAALGFGGRFGWIEATGELDAPQLALVERALALQPPGDGAARALLLARLSMLVYFDPSGAARRDRLGAEALAMARRLGDEEVLAYALNAARFTLWGSERLAQRLELADELLALAQRRGDAELELRGRAWRIIDHLEEGDAAAAEREIAAHQRLARRLRQPLYEAEALKWDGMLALMQGRLDDADRLAGELGAAADRIGDADMVQAAGIHLFLVRGMQGRMQELEPAARWFAQEFAAIPSWGCGLAMLHAELGRAEEARLALAGLMDRVDEFGRQAGGWMIGVALLAHVCAFVRDADAAARLYALLEPYRGRAVVVGYAAACLGAVEHPLGILADVLGQRERAAAHMEAALELNRRMGAELLLCWTQLDYARMLLGHDEPAQRARAGALLEEGSEAAQRTGSRRMIDHATALRLVAQGAEGVPVRSSIQALADAIPSTAPAAAAHREVTLLFSDIEGSTALNRRLGDRRWLALLHAHDELVRDAVAQAGGSIVKARGDGFMVVFAEPEPGVRCALDIQRRLAAGAAGVPLRVRIGLHAGRAIPSGGDWFGTDVNLAARVADAAAGGEVLVSAPLRAALPDGFRYASSRTVALKGLDEAHELWTVTS